VGWLSKLRAILGKIADFFIAGRQAGGWDRGPSAPGLEDVKAKDREPWRR